MKHRIVMIGLNAALVLVLAGCAATGPGSAINESASNGAADVPAALLKAIGSGKVKIVDCTFANSPEMPSIALPPQFGQNPPFKLHPISHYDEKGPAWYWNWFEMGEHTGTHVDAPNHWVSGKKQRRRGSHGIEKPDCARRSSLMSKRKPPPTTITN